MTEHYIRTSDNDVEKCISVLPSLTDETEKQSTTITIDSAVYELLKSKLLPNETMEEGIKRIVELSEAVKPSATTYYPIVPVSTAA